MVQCCPIKLFINVDIKCIYLGDRLTCKLRGTRQVFGKSHSAQPSQHPPTSRHPTLPPMHGNLRDDDGVDIDKTKRYIASIL